MTRDGQASNGHGKAGTAAHRMIGFLPACMLEIEDGEEGIKRG